MTRGRNAEDGEGATSGGTVSVSAGAVAARVAGGSGSSEAFGSPVAHGAPLRDEAAAAEEETNVDANRRGTRTVTTAGGGSVEASRAVHDRFAQVVHVVRELRRVIPPGHASVASPPRDTSSRASTCAATIRISNADDRSPRNRDSNRQRNDDAIGGAASVY